MKAAWLALLGLVLPAAVLQAPTQMPATLGWSLSILACVAWALHQCASGPAVGRRLLLLGGSAGSAVLALAVLGRGFSNAAVDPLMGLALLVGGMAGRVVHARWTQRVMHQEAQRQRELRAAASQGKSDFLDQLTRELRAPVHAVVGVADLLVEGGLDKEQRRHLAVFRRAAESLTQTLDDIRELTRLETGLAVLNETDVNVLPLVHEQVARIRQEAEQKGVKIQLTVAADTPRRVRADAQRLTQVLAHMLTHSVKATRQGRIHIELRPHARDARLLRFVVTDTSQSPMTGKLATLLDSFATPSTTTTAHTSRGIGLTLAQRMAECMGGRLCVRHSAGKGTTLIFSARLPAVDESPLSKPPLAVQPSAKATAPTGTPATAGAVVPASRVMPRTAARAVESIPRALTSVLLVDDNKTTRELIEAQLDRRHFRVTHCSNGREALHALEITRYDVVLMDLYMPDVDGWSALRDIRRRESEQKLSRTPVIALGDAPFELERQRSLKAGFDQHLCKPVRKSHLLECLATAVAPPAPTPTSAAGAGRVTSRLRYEQRDALSLLAAQDVIDVRTAVDGLGGDASIYLDAIEQLAPALSNWPTRFRDTLNRGETERAREMAGDMQGILDVVCAVPCAAALGRMADALAQPGPSAAQASALADLNRQLDALLTALHNAVDRLRAGRQERTGREEGHNSAF